MTGSTTTLDLEAEIRHLTGLLQDRRLDDRVRQLYRYLLMRLSTEAGLAGKAECQTSALATAMGRTSQTAGGWIVTPQALELLPAPEAGWTYRCAITEEPVDPAMERALLGLHTMDVGPNAEEKYRISVSPKPTGRCASGFRRPPGRWAGRFTRPS